MWSSTVGNIPNLQAPQICLDRLPMSIFEYTNETISAWFCAPWDTLRPMVRSVSNEHSTHSNCDDTILDHVCAANGHQFLQELYRLRPPSILVCWLTLILLAWTTMQTMKSNCLNCLYWAVVQMLPPPLHRMEKWKSLWNFNVGNHLYYDLRRWLTDDDPGDRGFM